MIGDIIYPQNRTKKQKNKIFSLVERVVAGYRDGQGCNGLFVSIKALSVEWDKQNLPCAILKHGRRDRFVDGDIKPNF